jgi:membrane protein DedA with SNARE-associated domain
MPTFSLFSLEDVGYLLVFAVLLLDGASVPFTPIEVFLGLTGYLVAIGQLDFLSALLVTVLGSLAGHLIGYALGYRYGRGFVTRFGKYFLVTPERFAEAEKLLKRHGPFAAFGMRFIPGLRSLTSPLLGIVKEPLVEFLLFTTFAVTLWNLILLLLGYFFGLAFASEAAWIVPLGIVGIAIGLGLVAVVWYRLSKKKHR